MANDTLGSVRSWYPYEFPDPDATEPGRSARPLKPLVPHVFSSAHLFLAKVSQRTRKERKVIAQWPREFERGEQPRVARSYYYVHGATWFRLYSIDFVTGELSRLGEWDDKAVARQWMNVASNSPDMRVPATRPRLSDDD